MNKILPLITPLLLYAPLCRGAVSYAPKSVLAQGNWVKTTVSETGLHEVSYAELRNMGFDDPSKVSVFGRGGIMLPQNFTDASGRQTVDNDLCQCAVWHTGGHLYFYAQATDNITWMPDGGLATGGYFTNDGRNIYSETGFYFLTDSADVLAMQEPTATGSGRTIYQGYGFTSHELDLYHNTINSGQLYCGETIDGSHGTGKMEWKAETHDLIHGEPGALECVVYTSVGATGEMSYGISGGGESSFRALDYASVSWTPQSPTSAILDLSADKDQTVYVTYSSGNGGEAYIDHWTLTYPKSIPTLRDKNARTQDFILLPDVLEGEIISIPLEASPSARVFDISDPRHPVLLPKPDDRGMVSFTSQCTAPKLLVADISRTQLLTGQSAGNYERIASQNLHKMASEGADMLIITTKRMHQWAEALADLHRQHDNMEVVVADVDEIYNEFSGGLPDPMAYRSLIKMFYQSERKISNVLLFGPIHADVRGMRTIVDPSDIIIGYQSAVNTKDKLSPNANMFLGMMSDYLNPAQLEKVPVEIGIGVLPCRFESDAATIVSKVADFLEDTTWAYTLNEFLAIGGVGDSHTHDRQAVNICTYVNGIAPGRLVASPLAIDAYGNDGARQAFLRYLNSGKMMTQYFGHGSRTMLGLDANFFCISDVQRLTNTHLPFMAFAACTISNFDQGLRGLGESMVLGTGHGAIGALLASRDTWSGQNQDMMRIFYNKMWRTGTSSASRLRPQPATLGEIWAATLSECTQANKLTYQLMADPALKLPVSLRTISCTRLPSEVIPGEKIMLTGSIYNSNGTTDTSFSGEVVVKVMLPAQTIRSSDFVTGTSTQATSRQTLDVTYSDRMVSMAAGNVEDGRFSVEVPVSLLFSSHTGENAIIHLAAYAPGLHVGAAGNCELVIGSKEGQDTKADTTPPVIEDMSFDPISGELNIVASDDIALSFADFGFNPGFSLTVDGLDYNDAVAARATLDSGTQRSCRKVALGHLSQGTHSACATVHDDAGNSTTKEIAFTIGMSAAYSLTLASGIASDGNALFEAEGELPLHATLHIVDRNGQEIRRITASGRQIEWDLLDSGEKRVKPGLYRAYLRDNGAKGTATHSPMLWVPVL